jgi:hypothetical protein
VTSIDSRRYVELCDRVRYRRGRVRADRVLEGMQATSPDFAVRQAKAGIAPGPVLWWLRARGIIRATGSGKLWLDRERRDRLHAGTSVRIVAYLAAASLLSGAAIAVTAAGI